jgi:hypothetical protein
VTVGYFRLGTVDLKAAADGSGDGLKVACI